MVQVTVEIPEGSLASLHKDPESFAREMRAGTPIAMDLLVDPVRLYETNQLRRNADGYKIAYGALTTSS